MNLQIGKFSIGMGDRFAQQAIPQLEACKKAAIDDIDLVPVWNKSNREHQIVGSEPASVRNAAFKAIKDLGWQGPWHVDADHIRFDTVERFIECSDFFTIDVADSIGKEIDESLIQDFVGRHTELIGDIEIHGISDKVYTHAYDIKRIAKKYIPTVKEAGRIYARIANAKGEGNFITEVSMDETDSPQTPLELLVILAALADERVPLQTIAPKFTGRFNKGVDYLGNISLFEKEFNDDIRVIAHAVKTYPLPANLKLSVHSGSDKFSIYPAIKNALERQGAGLHLKTAGTTWLEEMIGIAEAGGDGLDLAKEIYYASLEYMDELCEPYATVINIDRAKLPSRNEVVGWGSEKFAGALRHDQACQDFNPNMRQLIHVGFKIAAQKGGRYIDCIRSNREIVGRNVTANLFERHIKPVFPRKMT